MKNTFTFIVLTFDWSFAFALQPSQQLNYYGKEFYTQISTLKDDQLKTAIGAVLKSSHVHAANSPDQLVPSCAGKSSCSDSQVVLGYSGARKWMFGTYYLVTEAPVKYGVHEKYCNRIYDDADFKKGNGPGPGVIPDGTVVNTEHTWPQSKFTGKYATEMQKSDLHHLFPTDSKQNSLRGNFTFGEVVGGEHPSTCAASRFGNASNSHLDVFEPPTEHKGHVARALFYFATRYDMKISQPEEEILKKWNTEHPVDAEEMARNEEIFKIQGNRNPFIDYPSLAESISDF
jgi:deoxyribonuclease-1